MNQHSKTSRYGITLFVIGMLTVPGMDAFAKFLTLTMSAGQVAFARFVLQLPLVLLLFGFRNNFASLFTIKRRTFWILSLRGFLIAVATICFFLALSKMGLAETLAIFLLEPIFLTFFSSIILKEKISWKNIVTLAVGLTGALVIIRPSFVHFGWYALMPLISAIAFALYLLVTRFLMFNQGSLVVHFYTNLSGTLSVLVFLLVLPQFGFRQFDLSIPTLFEWSLMFGLASVGMLSHLLITLAFRYVQASTLAPLQYIEIFSATILGYMIFNVVLVR